MSEREQQSEFAELLDQLARWDRRRRLDAALTWVPRGLLAGLLLAALIAVAAWLRPLLDPQQLTVAVIACGASGAVGAAALVFGRRRGALEQARFADRRFRLRERAATAVEMESGRLSAPAALAAAQLTDTVRTVRRVDTARDYPLHIRRRDWMVLILAIALLIAAVALPNPQATRLLEMRRLQEQVDESAAALEALEEEIRQDETLTPEQQDALAEPLAAALEQLQEQGLTREELVATLSEAEADLRSLSAEDNSAQIREALSDAGNPLADSAAGQGLASTLQNGDLAGAAQAAAQLADDLDSLSPEAQAQLAQDLAEAAQALAGVDAELAQELAAAAESLSEGDVAAAQEALREAAGTLQQRAQENAGSQAAQAAAEAVEANRQAAAGGESGEGTTTAEGAGEGQQGEGSGEGSGQGQGQGEGSGQGQGEGSGQGQGQGEGGSEQGGFGGPSRGGGHSENVFVPEYADLSGEAGTEIELPAECRANPEACGGLLNERATEFGDERSLIPYNEVYGDYRDAAYEALSDDYIPLGYRDFIRDYFSSLEPE